jgi:hypothetical protein
MLLKQMLHVLFFPGSCDGMVAGLCCCPSCITNSRVRYMHSTLCAAASALTINTTAEMHGCDACQQHHAILEHEDCLASH